MPSKKTNFISGSCFGYFDVKFEDCQKCKIKDSCQNATNSDQVEEVRRIFKIKNSQVDELVNIWKHKK